MKLLIENLYFLGKSQKNKPIQEQVIQQKKKQKTVDNKTVKSVLVSIPLLAKPNQPNHFAFLKG